MKNNTQHAIDLVNEGFKSNLLPPLPKLPPGIRALDQGRWVVEIVLPKVKR